MSVTGDGGVVVRRREQWRELMRRGMPDDALYVIIDAPASEVITVRGDGGVPLVVRGDSSVVSLGADVRVGGRASVQVSGGACVMAFGSSRVRAGGYVRVAAHDDVRVWAAGACVVDAYGSARVWAGSQVSVYKCAMFGAFTGRVEGGRVVVKRNASDMSGRRWCRAQLVHVDEGGLAHLFKATGGQGGRRAVSSTVWARWWMMLLTGRLTGFLGVACMFRRRRCRRLVVRRVFAPVRVRVSSR